MANRDGRFVKDLLVGRGGYHRFTAQSFGSGGGATEVEECEPGSGVVGLVYVAGVGFLAFLLCTGSACLSLFLFVSSADGG